jgi:hypothetical protein
MKSIIAIALLLATIGIAQAETHCRTTCNNSGVNGSQACRTDCY